MWPKTKLDLNLFFATICTIITLVSVFALPDKYRNLTLFVLFLITVFFIAGFLYVSLQKRLLPLPTVDIPKEEDMYIVVPAEPRDVAWIAELEAEFYSTTDAVPKQFLEEWYDANPNGFFIIKNLLGKKVGHIDILPLRPKTLESFMEGHITEKGIRGECLYSSSDRNQITDLYVESVIINPKHCSNAVALRALIANFPTIVESVSEPLKVQRIHAIAASKAGSNLLLNLGFKVAKASSERTDRHDFFSVDVRKLALEINSRIRSTHVDEKNIDLLNRMAASRD